MTHCLAIIPARGGSEGLPGKNLKKIGGISLVGHAVLRALEADWIDKVLISTDAQDIADEAVSHGAECIELRPADLATADALAIDVWHYTWLQAEAAFDRQYDLCAWLEPTSPCRISDDFTNIYEDYENHKCDGVVTVSPLGGSANPHKLLKVGEDNTLAHYAKQRKENSNRQNNPDYVIRNGLIYLKDRSSIIDHKTIISASTRALVIDRPIGNIDTRFDLEMADWLMSRPPYI